jgi:hypothetical protein
MLDLDKNALLVLKRRGMKVKTDKAETAKGA